MSRILNFLAKEKVVLGIYVTAGLLTGIQHYRKGPGAYNNFTIFRQALHHMLAHKNMYLEYPSEYFDIFLYHPAFCILFSPFAFLPLLLAIVLWCIGLALILFYGIKILPVSAKNRLFFWWFILIELITSLHYQQTNPIIAALGLFTFSFLEKNKPRWASIFPVVAFCIKGYGLVFALLFLLYPKRVEYIWYSILWFVLLNMLPLIFLDTSYFIQVYKDWGICLANDHKINFGYSVMGLIKVWFEDFDSDDVIKVQCLGLLLITITWIKNVLNKNYQIFSQRLLLLSYTCLWVILFNHAAESPTYVIAVQGTILFYIADKNAYPFWTKLAMLLVLLFTMLVSSDVYPVAWRAGLFKVYLIKVIPCLLVWGFVQLQLLGLLRKRGKFV